MFGGSGGGGNSFQQMMLMQQLGLGGGMGGYGGGKGGMGGMHPLLLSSLLGGGCTEPSPCTKPNTGTELCGMDSNDWKQCCVC